MLIILMFEQKVLCKPDWKLCIPYHITQDFFIIQYKILTKKKNFQVHWNRMMCNTCARTHQLFHWITASIWCCATGTELSVKERKNNVLPTWNHLRFVLVTVSVSVTDCSCEYKLTLVLVRTKYGCTTWFFHLFHICQVKIIRLIA